MDKKVYSLVINQLITDLSSLFSDDDKKLKTGSFIIGAFKLPNIIHKVQPAVTEISEMFQDMHSIYAEFLPSEIYEKYPECFNAFKLLDNIGVNLSSNTLTPKYEITPKDVFVVHNFTNMIYNNIEEQRELDEVYLDISLECNNRKTSSAMAAVLDIVISRECFKPHPEIVATHLLNMIMFRSMKTLNYFESPDTYITFTTPEVDRIMAASSQLTRRTLLARHFKLHNQSKLA